jgi:hypothetical protein
MEEPSWRSPAISVSRNRYFRSALAERKSLNPLPASAPAFCALRKLGHFTSRNVQSPVVSTMASSSTAGFFVTCALVTRITEATTIALPARM